MNASVLAFPFTVLLHPVRGFEEIKYGGRGSRAVAAAIVVLLFLSEVFNRQLSGFPFNPYRPDRLNVLLVLAQTVAPYLLWVVANWCLCTLMDGEGRFSEICIATAYSLLPIVLITFLVAGIDNLMTLEEGAFLVMVQGVRQLWFILLLTVAMKVIHQYTLGKTIVSMALTVVGIGIILFLGILIFSLFQQLSIFLRTIYSEILFRR
jgi:hypothetical protein